MSQHDIERLYALLSTLEKNLTEKWEKSTQQTSAVGSDIKDLKMCFKEHLEDDRAFKEEMRPLLNGKRFIVYLGDFFKFIGLPLTAIGALFYWVLNK
jgi:hypothetical protein